MKIFCTFFILIISIQLSAQKPDLIYKVDSILENKKRIFDSLQLYSSDIENYVDNITYLEMFFNKMLMDDNYKKKEKFGFILNEYRSYLPDKYNFKVLYNDLELLIQARIKILFDEKYTLLKMYRKEIQQHLDDEISKTENSIVYLLTKNKVSIEYYNSLSDENKDKLLDELKKK